MANNTPNYLKPLQGAKSRLTKQLISGLIKALFSIQSGSKKSLIKLLLLLYFLLYGMTVHAIAVFSFAWEYRIITLACVFAYLLVRILFSKNKSRIKKRQGGEPELGI